MNREIKFRAWDRQYKNMVAVYSIDFLTNEIDFKTNLNEPKNLDHFELMQFTGLLDKNGKEIYEGDIQRQEIEFNYGDERLYFVCRWFPQTSSFVWMDYNDTMIDWEGEKDLEYPCSLLSDEQHKYCICGNEFEKPNLLEMGKEEMENNFSEE